MIEREGEREREREKERGAAREREKSNTKVIYSILIICISHIRPLSLLASLSENITRNSVFKSSIISLILITCYVANILVSLSTHFFKQPKHFGSK